MATYQDSRYNIALPSGSGGSLVLIKTLTASSSATLSFVDGTSDVVLDNTYKEYLFIFNNIHPATDSVEFGFQGNAAGGSGYNETITSTWFRQFHSEEGGSDYGVGYLTDRDQAQGTAFQDLTSDLGNGNDESVSGYLHLFNPSSTTFVKHFIATTNYVYLNDFTVNPFIAGYFNTTSAIDEIQFKMNSGNIDAGTIQLFGVS